MSGCVGIPDPLLDTLLLEGLSGIVSFCTFVFYTWLVWPDYLAPIFRERFGRKAEKLERLH